MHATTPMLRGVWGRALKFLNEHAYADVFQGGGAASQRVPKYIIRPAPPDPITAPAIDFILVNVEPSTETVLWQAWLMACGMGLGAQREPFRVREKALLISVGRDTNALDSLACDWPVGEDPARAACKLTFPTPLRILRKGKLLEDPSLLDLAVAGGRRLAHLAGLGRGTEYRHFQERIRVAAVRVPSTAWHGERADLVRWSAAQKREVKLYGVTGSMWLPHGPGELWPLFAALRWLHVGKGSVFGMGQLEVTQPVSGSPE